MYLYHPSMALGQMVRPYWRLGLVGEIDSIPRKGPVLIAANHQSFFDPWLIAFCFPHAIRYLITAEWYHKSPFWKWFFKGFGTEPVRLANPRATIDAVCEILARGEVAGIFPEGAISYDGKMKRFRPGLSRIAARSGVPVVPVGLRGSFRALPRTQLVPRPATIKIHVGKPMTFPGSPIDGPPPRDVATEFSDRVYHEILRLAGQDQPRDELANLAHGAMQRSR